ncbi:MAG: DNA polymerase III subunit alpha [Planctomycetes bacterium]|nr:DNA polymerase III subunit alpha [Planctomycetota bacterium]
MLVPLHVKSHYSLGEGTASPERLVDRAAMLGLPALGLTDVENLYGQVLFHRLTRERGIRPLTGAEIGRLVLLARDRTGYESLSRIITRRNLGEAGEDPVTSIRGHADGLFFLTGDLPTLERLLALEEIDRQAVRLLLVRPGCGAAAELAILEASSRLEVPLVADPDIVFLDPADLPLHRLKVAISRNLLVSQVEERSLAASQGRHFPGPREAERLFADFPGAVEETLRIAESCELDLRRSRPIFPRIPLPEGETAYSHLAKLAFRGLERRRPRLDSRCMDRLARELQVIERLGFCEYFIVVGGIVRFARERGIEVVGRGSGAGSLVAYALGVTNVDPLEHGLYFERFLHEGRPDLPDIDIDLCWIRRDEVIDHVYRAYGSDKVAMISSHVTLQPHMAFREALKAFGVPLEEVNRLSRRIPYIHPEVHSRTPLRDIIASSLTRDIPLDEEPFRTALPLAERLLNLPHHLSIHPGGIVIGDRAIDAYVPLERAAKGIVVTQYDMYSIEDVGLVKIDLLGNRCLTELQETLELVHRGREGGPPSRLEDIPDGDPGAVEVLRSARTIGCFQLESPAMRSLLAKLPLKGIRDCIAAVAIIRPGAAAGGAKAAYIRRSRGEEVPAYLHPSLRKVLEESHGVVIYEEDVMCIASAIAGLSLAEGDALRSAIKKARSPDDVLDLENDFLRRAVRNGVAPDAARAVWQDLRRFASYCFSKAHASGYGVLAYQSAYLKARFPVEFGCALLNNHAGMYSTRTIAAEVSRTGARILHPSVQSSEARFTVELTPDGPCIRTGLARVKGLAAESIEAFLDARRTAGPFKSLGDFLRRAPMPRREVEALILAGAFDGLPPPRGRTVPLNHPQLLWELESTARSRDPAGVRGPCLDLDDGSLEHPPLAPYDSMTRVRNELEVLEIAITDQPMRLLRAEAARRGCIATEEAARAVGRQVRVAGLVAASRSVRTRKGPMMRFLTIEDERGLLEATLFPAVNRASAPRLRSLGPYVLEGRVEEDHGAVSLNVARVEGWGGGCG